MDEFKAAGFDKETCERLREIMSETGIPPSSLIGAIRGVAPPQPLRLTLLAGGRKKGRCCK